jgi:hypothetical protein
MNKDKLEKVTVICFSLLGIINIIYVIICMLKRSDNFDSTIFPIYFVLITTSSYWSKENILKNKFVQYPLIIMWILFLIFLGKTYLV